MEIQKDRPAAGLPVWRKSCVKNAAPEIKRASLALTAISEAGTFEGYASLFNVADLGRDIVLPGAFRASLQKRGVSNIKLLWQHDPAEPVGTWQSITEDGRGLKVRGRLNLAVARAREILALMHEGTVDGLSIGFRTQRAITEPKTGLRYLQKLDLWEVSLVTFPMLPQARVTSVKQISGGNDRATSIASQTQKKSARLRNAAAARAMDASFRYLAMPR